MRSLRCLSLLALVLSVPVWSHAGTACSSTGYFDAGSYQKKPLCYYHNGGGAKPLVFSEKGDCLRSSWYSQNTSAPSNGWYAIVPPAVVKTPAGKICVYLDQRIAIPAYKIEPRFVGILIVEPPAPCPGKHVEKTIDGKKFCCTSPSAAGADAAGFCCKPQR